MQRFNIIVGEGGNYYYVDDNLSKIRYIMLNCLDFVSAEIPTNENKMYKHIIGTAQINWLKTKALKMEDNTWGSVICSHVAPWLSSDCPWNNRTTFISNAQELLDICNNFINKTDEFLNYKGEIICWLAGHEHNDYIVKKGNLNIVITANDSLSVSTVGYAPAKTKGTSTEQAFDVFTINKNTNTVNITRIGAGEDRSFTY